jgi:hypothetical protein
MRNYEQEEKNRQRIAISFNEELNRRFFALAEFDRVKPATLAAQILKNYMDSRTDDIDSVLKVRADYEKNIEQLRKQK